MHSYYIVQSYIFNFFQIVLKITFSLFKKNNILFFQSINPSNLKVQNVCAF